MFPLGPPNEASSRLYEAMSGGDSQGSVLCVTGNSREECHPQTFLNIALGLVNQQQQDGKKTDQVNQINKHQNEMSLRWQGGGIELVTSMTVKKFKDMTTMSKTATDKTSHSHALC